MIRQNLHTHTCFCDGKNSPMDMAQAALDAGLTSLGFSGHSGLPWDNDWGMTDEKAPAYRAAVAEAKAAFAGRLEIFCGLEWDAVSAPETAEGYDYVIGSVHHIDMGGEYPSVDDTPEVSKAALADYFGGDADAMAEAYFAQYLALAKTPFVDIVGHFDLLTKYDEKYAFFDEASPRYLDAAMAGMEALLKADKLFEVNTGAMGRGWRTAPYPSPRLLAELNARKARVLITSDAHSADTINYAFSEMEALLRGIGFREIWELTDQGFVPRPLG
ncbi:MAG: histidinol-phosphatase HisJ family protein [Oscillospiraceae bacterium]